MRTALVLLTAAIAGALLPSLSGALTDTLVLSRAKRGEVAFTHGRHAGALGIPCERCHHNLAAGPKETTCQGCHLRSDHRGLCHECHLSDRDDGSAAAAEAVKKRLGKDDVPTLYKAFHNLCRNCHAVENSQKKTKAPYECGGCHRAP